MTLAIDRMQIERDLDDMLAIDAASFTNPWTREMFEWEARHSDVARVYVCRADEDLVAYCAVWLVFDELHINTIAVAPAWRRRGIATVLLAHVFRDARQAGAERATLEVRRENISARRLYEGLGFELRGVRTGYYRSPPDDALVLWKDRLPDT